MEQTENKSPPELTKNNRNKKYKNVILRFFAKLLFLLCLVYLLLGILFGLMQMPNEDMKPVIRASDLILYQRTGIKIRQNDVVVYLAENQLHVGRIIAQSGDIVEVTYSDTLKINNSIVVEQDIYFPTPVFASEVSYPLEIGEGEYFILGDYRENAKDSRYYGAISETDIKGKVINIIRRNNI